MIVVSNIVKSFEEAVVLDHISVDLYDGQVNMIIGASGSGKTVLMKSIIGLYRVDSGSIEYDGRNITDMSESKIRLLHKEIGMLFQGAALFDSMSVIDNVLFPLEMFTESFAEEREVRARECLNRVNIPERAFHLMPSEISGGMQKRVAIARAISMNPHYLFCDEPNSGLDPETSLIIDQLLKELTIEYNICTIINSHDMNSIMEIGDNIIFMKNGIKEWQGSRFDIFEADNENLNHFVFASELFQKVKKAHNHA